MATNPPGKGKAIVACSVPAHVAELVLARSKLLGWSRSKYAGLLLERWYQDGCVPVSDTEITLLDAEAKKLPLPVERAMDPYHATLSSKKVAPASG